MKRLAWLCGTVLGLMAGCPQPPTDSAPAVTARIAISSTQGDPPLAVLLSGAASSSRNGGTLRYAWDIGGQAQADTATASHTFTRPGLYVITLRVTDEKDETGVAQVEVRVRGSNPTAVIQADVHSGPAPLLVRFDGTASSAPDDVVRDYFWDFDDASAGSRQPAPFHTFDLEGTYAVTLTVRTAGGAEGSTSTTISVGRRNGSLQFDGSQFAALPLGEEKTLTACTFEAWFRAGPGGGPLVTTADGALTVAIQPEANRIHFRAGGQEHEATAANLAGSWRHVALTADATGQATLYLDGVAFPSVVDTGEIRVTELTIGMGFVGKIADVRLWDVARSAAQIAGNYDRRLTGAQAGLLGYWRFDEGAGQGLSNLAGPDGTRGATAAVEMTDPAWSSDGPNLK